MFGHPSKREVHATWKPSELDWGNSGTSVWHDAKGVTSRSECAPGCPNTCLKSARVFSLVPHFSTQTGNGCVLSTGMGSEGIVIGTQVQVFGHPFKREVHVA